MKNYLNEILILLGDEQKKLPKFFFLFLIVSMFELIGIGLIGPYIAIVVEPGLAQSFLNKLSMFVNVPGDQKGQIIFVSLILITVFAVKTLSTILINYSIIKFSIGQEVRLRSYLMNGYQNMPYQEYLLRNSSEYIYSIQSLVSQYSSNVLHHGMKLISDGVIAIVILLFLAWTNLAGFLILIALLGIAIYIYDKVFSKSIHTWGKRSNTTATKMVQGINEGIEGLKEIRILGMDGYFYTKVNSNVKEYASYYVKSQVITSTPRYLLDFIMVLFIVLLVILTIAQGKSSSVLLPTLGIFGLAAVRLLPISNSISSGIAQFRFNRDSVSRLYSDFINLSPSSKLPEKEEKEVTQEFQSLTLKKIDFSYPNTIDKTLNNVTLKISAGESIGIIGPSGSGKTTLIDVLLGLLEIENGEIKYNNRSFSASLSDWRKHIAYIPQQIFMIDNTLKRNIALGVPDNEIDEKHLLYVLEMARLNELVEKLSDGINTVIGERGVRLSGGQRQRVALARALYHKRDVLVMDEATSSLDYETENEIVQAITKLKGKITMIVIAHRTSTIKHCDHIYKLESGKVVSSGSAQEML